MKRIKYILAAGLLIAGLGGPVYGGTYAAPASARQCTDCCPPEGCFPVALAEGPIDEPPEIPQGVQASDPGLLAEGELETGGRHIPTAVLT